MKFTLRQQEVKIITGILVAVFAFTFLHSEFGFLTPEHHSHQTHDFCQLVDGTTTQIQKTVGIPLWKPTVVKEICFHCLNEHTARNQKTQFLKIADDFLHASLTTDLSIENRTFLI